MFVGLTGGTGAGKSEALAAFSRLGAATVSADELVHELLGQDELRDRLTERWGDEVAPGGEIDRARVAAIVFERPEELAWLESQLHPLVAARVAAWRAGLPDQTRVAVVEVPLLFEIGMEPCSTRSCLSSPMMRFATGEPPSGGSASSRGAAIAN